VRRGAGILGQAAPAAVPQQQAAKQQATGGRELMARILSAGAPVK
jgi:hypothetical protein